MKIHEAAQGTQAWLEARAGIPTASEFHRLLTPKFEARTGEMVKSYLAQKLAEKWAGPLLSGSSFAMEQGTILEDIAIPWYEFRYDIDIQRVGLITTDDGRIGCSPDGLLVREMEDHFETCGLEIKCPEPTNHVKYLLNGVVPDDYLTQVHGSLFVTEMESWTFVSYRRGFPALVLGVIPDEEIQEKIAEALAAFLAKLDSAWQRLCEMNGGPPEKREPMVFSTDEWQAEREMVQNAIH